MPVVTPSHLNVVKSAHPLMERQGRRVGSATAIFLMQRFAAGQHECRWVGDAIEHLEF